MVEFIAALPGRLRTTAIPPGQSRSHISSVRWQELLVWGFAYLVVGLLVRGGTLGFPVIHIDEQFYLLVGDRMLHGAVPFVDIWDRKPIGLFLVYAAIRLLGGAGIVQYQLIAMACAVATSLVIYRIARFVARPSGAWWAGVAYQLYLSVFFCFGGQAPVFYNLLMALSGLAMLRIWTAPTARYLLTQGLAVMLILGLAIQIKYTVLFEGGAFGLALLWRARKSGWSMPATLGAGLCWCGAALVPTLAAWGFYGAIGHGNDFLQANFLSIFSRHEAFGESLWRLTKETAALAPVWCALHWSIRHGTPDREGRKAYHFLLYWAAAAVLGFLVFGTWYDHYVAPLLVPLMICCAPALGRPRPLRWMTAFLIGFGMIGGCAVTIYNMRHHGTTEQVDEAATMIRAASSIDRGNPCLYINEGDPILYYLTGSCFATRYIFPNHLNSMVEVNALDVNVDQEVHRIMATHPRVVVMSAVPSSLPVNWDSRNLMFHLLATDYHVYGMVDVGWRKLFIYQLNGKDSAARPGINPTH